MKESTEYKLQVVFTIAITAMCIGAIVGILPREILHYQVPLVIWIRNQ